MLGRRNWTAVFVTLLLGAIIIVAGEAFARFYLGLGTPLLSVRHQTIEYMFRPNQDLIRFHNRQLYNEYGMRTPSIAASPYDRLVLAFGDSVLNGGALTDHDFLGTTLASRILSNRDNRVLVGHVSAGSWGPGNIRAWLDEYGFLGAKTVIFMFSSHDATDTPTFAPLDPTTHPTSNPPLAITEAIQRYLPRYLPDRIASFLRLKPSPQSAAHIPATEIPSAKEEIKTLLERVRSSRVRVCLVQHLTHSELQNGPQAGFFEIGALFRDKKVPIINLGERLADSLETGIQPYRDDIHINDAGQVILAAALTECDRIARVPT